MEEAKTQILARITNTSFTDNLLLVEIDKEQELDRLCINQSVHTSPLGRTFWSLDSPRKLPVLYNPFFPS